MQVSKNGIILQLNRCYFWSCLASPLGSSAPDNLRRSGSFGKSGRNLAASFDSKSGYVRKIRTLLLFPHFYYLCGNLKYKWNTFASNEIILHSPVATTKLIWSFSQSWHSSFMLNYLFTVCSQDLSQSNALLLLYYKRLAWHALLSPSVKEYSLFTGPIRRLLLTKGNPADKSRHVCFSCPIRFVEYRPKHC